MKKNRLELELMFGKYKLNYNLAYGVLTVSSKKDDSKQIISKDMKVSELMILLSLL